MAGRWAGEEGHVDVMKALLPALMSGNYEPMADAEIMRIFGMIDNPNLKTRAAVHALYVAAIVGYHQYISQIVGWIPSNANRATQLRRALLYASINGHPDCVQQIFHAGGRDNLVMPPAIHVPRERAWSLDTVELATPALIMATYHNHVNVFRTLLILHNHNQTSRYTKRVTLVAIDYAIRYRRLDILRAGIERRVLFDKSHLRRAAENGDAEIVTLILSGGLKADVGKCSAWYGCQFAMGVAKSGGEVTARWEEVLRVLEENGGRPVKV
ncbi:hypothetical protein HDV00_009052 [Rhizophlyctis rosea]|nr:hypothetical protein HDV00_009052 [Rhizophlyctis rosea]